MLTASMGVLNIAADLREKWLFNIYSMGRDAIKDGSKKGPYAYIIPNDQWDAYETGKLRKGGCTGAHFCWQGADKSLIHI